MGNVLEIFKNNIKLSIKNKKELVKELKNKILSEDKEVIYHFIEILDQYDNDLIYFRRLYKKMKKWGQLNNSTSFVFTKIFYKHKDLESFIDAYQNALLTSIFNYDSFKQFWWVLKINDISFYKKLIKNATSDHKLIAKLFDIREVNANKITKKIERFGNNTLDGLAKKLLFESFNVSFNYHNYQHREIFKGSLIKYLILYFSKKDKNFLDECLTFLNKKNILKYRRDYLDLFANTIQLHQVENFVNFAKNKQFEETEIKWHIYFCTNLYYTIERGNRPDKKKVLNKIYEYIWKDIEEDKLRQELLRKEQEEREQKANKDRRDEIEKVINLVKEKKDIISEWLIHEYADDRKYWFIDQDKDIIREQVIRFFEDNKYFIPEKSTRKKDKEVENRYTTSKFIINWTMWKCIKLLKDFNVDPSPYRYKIISYIPFAYTEDFNEIFGLFNDVREKEIDYMISRYSEERDKIDDLRLNFPDNFLWFYGKYRDLFSKDKKKKAIEICKNFINENISKYIKEQAINILERENINISYFQLIFKKFNYKLNYFKDVLTWNTINKQQKDDFYIATLANSILIKYNNSKSIHRRISQINEWILEYKWREHMEWEVTVYSVSDLDAELERHEKRPFIEIFKEIKDIKYKNNIIGMLKKSFEIAKNNPKHIAFADYIQNAVFYYLTSLKLNPQEFEPLYQEIVLLSDNNRKVSYRFKTTYLNRLEEIYNIQIQDSFSSLNDKEKANMLIENNKELFDIQIQNKKLIQENAYLKSEIDEYIILTEWKSDRKHLLRARRELKTDWATSRYSFDFEKSIGKYESSSGNWIIHNRSMWLAEMFPEKLIICIFDADEFNDETKNHFGLWDTTDLIRNNIDNNSFFVNYQIRKNYYWVFINNARKSDEFYKKNWICIELYYKDSLISNYFYTKKWFNNMSIENFWWIPFYYDKKNKIYIKQVWNNKWKLIHDTTNNYYDKNLKEIDKNKFDLCSKNDFAELVKNGKITSNWNFFIPIFNSINEAIKDFVLKKSI